MQVPLSTPFHTTVSLLRVSFTVSLQNYILLLICQNYNSIILIVTTGTSFLYFLL